MVILNNGNEKRANVEFYLPDVSWKEFKLSTKESFLVLVDQSLKANAGGIEISITSDAKAQISMIMGEKVFPIVNISSGIFDRYWEFLSCALKSENGLRVKVKDEDKIYDIACEVVEHQSGRKIIMRFSPPMKEKDILNIVEEEDEAK